MSAEPPEGYHTLTPRILLADPTAVAPFVEFLRETFEASGAVVDDRPAEVRIGDSVLLVSSTDLRDPATAFLYVYVADTEATYERALAGRARSIEAPTVTPHGDRRATVRDPWGNVWQIATREG